MLRTTFENMSSTFSSPEFVDQVTTGRGARESEAGCAEQGEGGKEPTESLRFLMMEWDRLHMLWETLEHAGDAPEKFTRDLVADVIDRCPGLVASSAKEHLGYSASEGRSFDTIADWAVFKREIARFISSGRVVPANEQ